MLLVDTRFGATTFDGFEGPIHDFDTRPFGVDRSEFTGELDEDGREPVEEPEELETEEEAEEAPASIRATK